MTQASGPPRAGKNREWPLLFLLLSLFIIVALYSEQAGQAVVAKTATSSLNNRPQGTKALFRLFGTMPYTVRRLTDPWTTLTLRDGLLVVIEKFDAARQPSEAEVRALAGWARQGGTVLYFVEEPARPLDAGDPLAGDVAIIDARDTPSHAAPVTASPLTRGVTAISVSSKVRLAPAGRSAWQTLFRDEYGVIVAQKPLGKGRVIVAADPLLVSNQGVPQADNVVFLANAVQSAIGQTERDVVFDEYHHGVGFEAVAAARQNWISALPLPLKRAAWAGVALLLVLLYNGNQRFGAARAAPLGAFRPSADYVHSLARWYRRAEAADIVAETLLNDLLHSIALHLELPPDTDAPTIQAQYARRHPGSAAILAQIITVSRQIIADRRANPDDLVDLVRDMEQFKRNLQSSNP